jgi:hypothetical protein
MAKFSDVLRAMKEGTVSDDPTARAAAATKPLVGSLSTADLAEQLNERSRREAARSHPIGHPARSEPSIAVVFGLAEAAARVQFAQAQEDASRKAAKLAETTAALAQAEAREREWERKLDEAKRAAPEALATSIERMKEEQQSVRHTQALESQEKIEVVRANAQVEAARVALEVEKVRSAANKAVEDERNASAKALEETKRASAKELEEVRIAGARALEEARIAGSKELTRAQERTKVWVAVIGLLGIAVGAVGAALFQHATSKPTPSTAPSAAPSASAAAHE